MISVGRFISFFTVRFAILRLFIEFSVYKVPWAYREYGNVIAWIMNLCMGNGNLWKEYLPTWGLIPAVNSKSGLLE